MASTPTTNAPGGYPRVSTPACEPITQEINLQDRGDDVRLSLIKAAHEQYNGEIPMFMLDAGGDLRTVRSMRSYLGTLTDQPTALFPSRKSPRMTPKGINDVVKRAAERAEVRPYSSAGRGSTGDVSAHTLRHSVAWHMLRAKEGNTLYDVRNRLRHATILTTERKYDHFECI